MGQWRKLRNYPSYEITRQGEVRNSVTGTILKPQRTPQGYRHVTLCDDIQKPNREQIEYSLAKAVNARKRPVRNIETGACYSSLAECAKKENLARSAVSFHVGGKARKQRFEYADEGGGCNGPTKS